MTQCDMSLLTISSDRFTMGSMKRSDVVAALLVLTPSLRNIAERLGVSYSTIRAYKQNRLVPPPARLKRLARLLREEAGRFNRIAKRLDP